MTPTAIREADGPALDAFVLERVCGLTPDANGWRGASEWEWWRDTSCNISTDNAACWRWVVPALVAKKWGVRVESCDAKGCEWHVTVTELAFDREYQAAAPTPALAIARAAALTVAEGGE